MKIIYLIFKIYITFLSDAYVIQKKNKVDSENNGQTVWLMFLQTGCHKSKYIRTYNRYKLPQPYLLQGLTPPRA